MHRCLSGTRSSDQTRSSNDAAGKFSLEGVVSSLHVTLSTSVKNCSVFGVWVCSGDAGHGTLVMKVLLSCRLGY